MTETATLPTINDADLAAWHRDGFHVARNLFSSSEVAEVRARFDRIAEAGDAIPGHWEPDDSRTDVLGRYPRVMHPHAFDPASRALLLDPRLRTALTALLGEEPVACQTMFYFKPPGARGQAFHQDNYYLRVQPDSCIAAWVAIDRSHPANGGLQVCPGTHTMEVACPELSDSELSFTTDYVPPPEGHDPVGLELEPGDVLFFNGSVVHGSNPNSTTDEWRRSFICHYMPARASHIWRGYHEHLLDFAGNPVTRETSTGGGPCGEEFRREGAGDFH